MKIKLIAWRVIQKTRYLGSMHKHSYLLGKQVTLATKFNNIKLNKCSLSKLTGKSLSQCFAERGTEEAKGG